MTEGCIGNCLACGKCAGISFSILDSFESHGLRFKARPGYGVAVDVGTTSMVLALMDLTSGEIVARHSFMNPQRAFGADVISRISAANGGKLEELRLAVTQAAARGIRELLESRNIPPEQLTDMVVAGNTAMTYLLLGFPCESLGVFPFKPAYRLADGYDFPGVFGESDISCRVRILPWFAAFVGGDIVAGMLHALSRDKNRFLLIDLGTNGEMALYCEGALSVTSTAAGPAFEGGRHAGGASGVLAELAGLVRDGIVDETGLLDEEASTSFTQKDIRDLQLAKSAVRSGLEILLESGGLTYSELDAVYLAGGIGQAVNPDSAVTVGLLPRALREKVCALGNASLGGAAQLLLMPERMAAADGLLAAAEEINLSAHPRFNDCFMEYMYFEEDE